MGFFGIGGGEILLVLIVALIIWGPGKLPEIARTMGKAVRTLKKASFDLTSNLTREIEANERPASQPGETTAVNTRQPLPDVKETKSEHKDNPSDNPERPQQ